MSRERLLDQVRNRRASTGRPLPAPVTQTEPETPPLSPVEDPGRDPRQFHVHVHMGPTEPPVVHNHITAPEIHLPEQPAPVVNVEHHSHIEQPRAKKVRATKLKDGSTEFVSE